jgi:4-amino-4-deoxy-L-arabinose transferase-like glycosyltransferase
LTLWAVAEFTRRQNANWWLLAGTFAGLALLSKYTAAFLGIGLLFYLLTSRERIRWLKHWQVWGGAVLALLMFSPVIWIGYRYNWDSFRFQLGRSTLDHPVFSGLGEFGRFLAEEAVQLLPTLAVFVVLGVGLYFGRRARGLALPLLTSVPMATYFLVHAVFGRANPNWTAPLFPELALIGAWAAVTVRPGSRWLRWPLDLLYVLHVPIGVGLLFLVFIATSQRALPIVGPLPILDYVYGWDNLQRKVSILAHDEDAQWVDIGDYGLNSMIAYQGVMAHDPLPVLNTVQAFRYRFRPPVSEAQKSTPHLVLRSAGNEPGPEGAIPLGRVTRDYAGAALAKYDVFLVK